MSVGNLWVPGADSAIPSRTWALSSICVRTCSGGYIRLPTPEASVVLGFGVGFTDKTGINRPRPALQASVVAMFWTGLCRKSGVLPALQASVVACFWAENA